MTQTETSTSQDNNHQPAKAEAPKIPVLSLDEGYAYFEGQIVPMSEAAHRILRELAEYANGLTSKMFGELSTEEVKRDERPVETNPREELAQRIKDYAKAHNLHPINDAKTIQDEVFKADPALKEAYARS